MATFISERVSGRLAAKVMLKAFRTIGWSFDLFSICSYASLIVFGITAIAESIPLGVFLKPSALK